MKITHKYITRVLAIALFCFCFQSAQAQISFPDNVNDEAPTAPINKPIKIYNS